MGLGLAGLNESEGHASLALLEATNVGVVNAAVLVCTRPKNKVAEQGTDLATRHDSQWRDIQGS